MKNLLIYSVCLAVIMACNNSKKTNELEQKNIELQDSIKRLTMQVEQKAQKSSKKLQKKLRYLYWANAGFWAFYDDGTYTYCSRCDAIQVNVRNVYNDNPTGKYDIIGNKLVTDDNEFIIGEDEYGWAMIDYEWKQNLDE
jgi:hypothetical protein